MEDQRDNSIKTDLFLVLWIIQLIADPYIQSMFINTFTEVGLKKSENLSNVLNLSGNVF